MKLNRIKFLFFIMVLQLISGCGSSKFVPTSDVCTIVKQYEDPLYQIQINRKTINNFWYLKEDAIKKISLMEEKNICNRANPIEMSP